MINLIKDLLNVFSRRLHIRRLTFKDRIINNWLVFKWQLIKIFHPNKMNNLSNRDKKNYTLVFEDNFDKKNWDIFGDDRWKIGESWGMWHPNKSNVYYGEPKLDKEKRMAKFTCKYKPKEFITENGEVITIPYEVSLLSSNNWFKKKYGRFECRMSLPNAPQSFPAFWLWGGDPYAEIDIFEGNGRKSGKTIVYQDMNLHWVDEEEIWKQLRISRIKLDSVFSNFKDKFYEFALEWTPNKIEIFTNGVKVFQYTKKEVLEKRFSIPMLIVINNSIRSNYKQHNESYYSEFYVDYIRVYDFKT